MSYRKDLYIDGHEVVLYLNELDGELKIGLENTIGRAKRNTRDYNPGSAIAIVMNRGIEKLMVNGHEVQWKTGKERIPMLFDEDDRDLVDRLLGEILRQKNAKRLLLRKQEYADVFEEYVLPDDEPLADLNPTASPSEPKEKPKEKAKQEA